MKLTRTSVAVQADIKSGKINADDVVGSLVAISKVAEEQMGGTSGAIYSCVPQAPNIGAGSKARTGSFSLPSPNPSKPTPRMAAPQTPLCGPSR